MEFIEGQIRERASRLLRAMTGGLEQMRASAARGSPEKNRKFSGLPGHLRVERAAQTVERLGVARGVEIGKRREILEPQIERKLRAHGRRGRALARTRLACAWRSHTLSAAAVGSAINTPKKPNSCAPARIAKMTATGCRPMRLPTKRGVST